jgi:hypothetical protein
VVINHSSICHLLWHSQNSMSFNDLNRPDDNSYIFEVNMLNEVE